MLNCGDLSSDLENDWTRNKLKPYFKYQSRKDKGMSMFNGAILNPIRVRNNRFIYPLYGTFGEFADKLDWKLFINYLFKPGVNLSALSKLKLDLDIWITIPYPLQYQEEFGTVSFKSLNFKKDEDRFIAVQWWLTKFMKIWNLNKEKYNNLSIKGFVWQREAIMEQDYKLVQQVNQFIHNLGLLSMWLPNYGSYFVINWRDLGFDMACLNSNFYGNTSYDYKWILNASNFAKNYEMGFQLNYGKGLIFNQYHHIDYLNLGLPEYCNYMKDCFIVHRFHNKSILHLSETDRISLYDFIHGKYKKTMYPGILY